MARKPLDGGIAENVIRHGTGAINVTGCRIGVAGGTRKIDVERYKTTGNSLAGSVDGSLNGGTKETLDAGRWPANVILSHSQLCEPTGNTRRVSGGVAVKRNGVEYDGLVTWLGTYAPGTADGGFGDQDVDVWNCTPDCPIRQMDEQSGDRPSTLTGRAAPDSSHPHPSDAISPHLIGPSGLRAAVSRVYADNGGASRFFYHAKVSRKERNEGCEHLPLRSAAECTDREDGSAGIGPQAGAGRSGGAHNFHPTLKPIALTEYLAKLLLLPTPGRLLVPYAGSGSEMIGALRAGWDHVEGIEREADYVTIAHARIQRWLEVPAHVEPTESKPVPVAAAQTTLFTGTHK